MLYTPLKSNMTLELQLFLHTSMSPHYKWFYFNFNFTLWYFRHMSITVAPKWPKSLWQAFKFLSAFFYLLRIAAHGVWSDLTMKSLMLCLQCIFRPHAVPESLNDMKPQLLITSFRSTLYIFFYWMFLIRSENYLLLYMKLHQNLVLAEIVTKNLGWTKRNWAL